MTSNQREPAGPENQEKYEATVLDFLDKEMAAIGPAPKKKEQHTEELDNLVTDLLKQVMTEADAPNDVKKLLIEDDGDLLSGLLDTPKQSAPAAATPEPKVAQPAAASISSAAPAATPPLAEPKQAKVTVAPQKAEKAPKTPKSKAAPAPMASVLASDSAIKKKMPLIAAAVAGLVLIIGTSIYFLSGSSSKKANVSNTSSQPAATPVSEAKPAAAQPAPQAPAPAPAPVNAAKSTPNVAAAKNQKPAAPVTTQQANTQTKPANPKSKPEPAPAVVNNTPAPPVNEAKPVAAQPAPQPPAPTPAPASTPAPSSAAVERPAPAPAPTPEVTVQSKPAPPERQPTPPAPAAVNPAPAPQPAATAAAPAAPKALVAAVAITKTSPVYPELAMRSRLTGSVALDLEIDEQGKVVKAKALSGPIIFHDAAIAAAMKWRYKPASIGGTNVRSKASVTMDFKLTK
jgi:periplasmic protein TonB